MQWMLGFLLLAVAVAGGQAASLASATDRQKQAAEFIVPVVQNLTNVGLNLRTSENEVSPYHERCPAGMQPLQITTESYVQYMQCLQSHMDMDVLGPLARIARLTGSWTGFFRSFCSPLPQMIECVRNFSDTMRTPCTNQEGVESIEAAKRGGASALNYLCFNEGQRMAEFTDAGGMQCITTNKAGLQTCTATMVGALQHLANPEAGHSTVTVAETTLKVIADWRVCLVDLLRTCPRPEPANILENLFENLLGQVDATD